MKDALRDLSTTTTIPYFTLRKLFDRLSTVISYNVGESRIEKDDICELDIGIGTLLVLVNSDEIKYKFIPSKKLSESVVTAVQDGKFELITDMEDSLRKKVMNTYKDLF